MGDNARQARPDPRPRLRTLQPVQRYGAAPAPDIGLNVDFDPHVSCMCFARYHAVRVSVLPPILNLPEVLP